MSKTFPTKASGDLSLIELRHKNFPDITFKASPFMICEAEDAIGEYSRKSRKLLLKHANRVLKNELSEMVRNSDQTPTKQFASDTVTDMCIVHALSPKIVSATNSNSTVEEAESMLEKSNSIIH